MEYTLSMYSCTGSMLFLIAKYVFSMYENSRKSKKTGVIM